MELGSDRAEREARLMTEIAEQFPGIHVERVWGVGFQAIPDGVPVLTCITLDGLKAKMEKQREQLYGYLVDRLADAEDDAVRELIKSLELGPPRVFASVAEVVQAIRDLTGVSR